MQLLEGELVLSASDLTGFAACAHLTQLELSVVRGERTRPDRDDPMLDVLSRRGTEHEEKHLAREYEAGKVVVEIPGDCFTRAELVAAQEATLEAMRAGADTIYQATFFDGRWRGHADFLVKVDTPSNLGNWSYEVADTKLARRVKAAAILQMAAYSEQLAALQGVTPEHIHVVTGDGVSHPFRLADYAAYHRHIKARYEALVLAAPGAPGSDTYPEPVDHCGICRWADDCKDRRRADDHLSLVSGLRRDQVHKLAEAGITTRVELAHAPSPLNVPNLGDATAERLRHQAELQVRGDGQPPFPFEILPPEVPPADPEKDAPRRGWGMLPAPSPGDIYFDMEGDPYALDDDGSGVGLEYLFGAIVLDGDDSTQRYVPFWAHDRAAEKRAFENFIDFVMARRKQHPDLHVYHYAPYETSAMKRLMGAHRTREAEVDELLRADVFVDLYAAVRSSVRIGTESYSLKQVEKLYMKRAEGEVMDAGGSIVAYEAYLDDGDTTRLDDIAMYNEEDCASTLGLHRWLEEQRAAAEQQYGPIDRPKEGDGTPSDDIQARIDEAEELADQLTRGVPPLASDRTPEEQARWLLAQLVDWHRRESKPEWWAHFARLAMSPDELFDDRESISGLVYDGDVEEIANSVVQRFTFPAQDHKFHEGSKPLDPVTVRGAGEVMFVDDIEGVIHLKRGRAAIALGNPRALVPQKPLDNKVLEQAIRRVARSVIANGISGDGPYQPARDLLLRTPRQPSDGSFDHPYLAIQGPPGAGKTYTGAGLVLELVRAGKKVGLTAHSHAAIGNLLDAVGERAAQEGVAVRALQKAEHHQLCPHGIVSKADDNARVLSAIGTHEFDVFAGTAWLWAREDMQHSVDVLFVDEAGQKSLADVVAVSGAALHRAARRPATTPRSRRRAVTPRAEALRATAPPRG
ncbi:MAG: TM0106 family RecB-like putative nuclease [Acidimicrobiia bacterium]